VDDRGHARAPEGLVVLAPADEPVVGRDLEEVEGALTGVRVQGLEPGDFHGGHYSAGAAAGTETSCAVNRRLAGDRKRLGGGTGAPPPSRAGVGRRLAPRGPAYGGDAVVRSHSRGRHR